VGEGTPAFGLLVALPLVPRKTQGSLLKVQLSKKCRLIFAKLSWLFCPPGLTLVMAGPLGPGFTVKSRLGVVTQPDRAGQLNSVTNGKSLRVSMLVRAERLTVPGLLGAAEGAG
jgi:hypothetical protein